MVRDIKIKKSFLIYFLIMLSFFHATLRLGPDSFLSAYRVTIPMIYLMVYLPNFKAFNKETLILIVIFVWNITTSVLFYSRFASFFVFYFHILSIFSVYILMKILKLKTSDFSINFYRFLDRFTIATIILFILQYLIRFEFPNTFPGRLSLFYWSENELGMSLAIMGPLYIFRFLQEKHIYDLLKIIAICSILFINDNKVCLIGIVVAFISYFLFIFIRTIREKRTYLLITGVLGVLLCFGLFYWNPILKFRDYSIALNIIILDPVIRIINLSPYHLGGSIYDRTDAIIYGLMELKRSYFLGIGLGNANEMLTLDKYHLETARSMHNFIAQIIVEMGILGLFLFWKIIKRIFKGITQRVVRNIDLVRFFYLTSFLFISMQSSSGIFSNYFIWAVLGFLFLSEDLFVSDKKSDKDAILQKSVIDRYDHGISETP
jgi:hypothetical protein